MSTDMSYLVQVKTAKTNKNIYIATLLFSVALILIKQLDVSLHHESILHQFIEGLSRFYCLYLAIIIPRAIINRSTSYKYEFYTKSKAEQQA